MPSQSIETSTQTFPLRPPKDWFDVPEPNEPQPLTFHSDGRVNGHLALWNQCHVGFLPECVQVTPGDDFSVFHTGALETESGDQIPVGKVIFDTKHASTYNTPMQAAAQHYDDNGHVAAYVTAREGRHGIWLSGAVKHDLSETDLRDVRANPPSGDWRGRNGRLNLVSALAVPIPGFPIPQVAMALTASGAVETLILPGYTEQAEEESTVTVEPLGREFTRRRKMLMDSIDYLDVTAMTAAATTFTAKERQRLAGTGAAMPDGSYPIRNCQDWKDAQQSIGRTPPGRRAAVQAHINKRGNALGCSSGGN